jgi:hypothetical protein
MRDPVRISRILDKLLMLWEASPDWRLGQLIMNCIQKTGVDPFSVEDDVVEAGMDKWLDQIFEEEPLVPEVIYMPPAPDAIPVEELGRAGIGILKEENAKLAAQLQFAVRRQRHAARRAAVLLKVVKKYSHCGHGSVECTCTKAADQALAEHQRMSEIFRS